MHASIERGNGVERAPGVRPGAGRSFARRVGGYRHRRGGLGTRFERIERPRCRIRAVPGGQRTRGRRIARQGGARPGTRGDDGVLRATDYKTGRVWAKEGVVVGGGGSGLMAAVEAAAQGVSVLVVEHNADLGGITATSVGSISAAGTQLQRDCGYEGDTTDAMFADTLKSIPSGGEAEFDLETHGEPEFDAWRWGYLEEAPELVVPFKRAVYERVAEAFAVFAAPKGHGASAA